jgi:hypothetical protein
MLCCAVNLITRLDVVCDADQTAASRQKPALWELKKQWDLTVVWWWLAADRANECRLLLTVVMWEGPRARGVALLELSAIEHSFGCPVKLWYVHVSRHSADRARKCTGAQSNRQGQQVLQ